MFGFLVEALYPHVSTMAMGGDPSLSTGSASGWWTRVSSPGRDGRRARGIARPYYLLH